MTRYGVALFPCDCYCPDRWQYKFDGQNLEIIEEFDDMPEEKVEMTINIAKMAGFEIEKKDNTLSLTRQVTQEEAVQSGLSEFIGQAVVLGLIPLDLQAVFYKELVKPLRTPVLSVGGKNAN